MHSKKKMQERYPWVLPYLKYLYTGRDLHLNGSMNGADQMMSRNETKNCKKRGIDCDEYAEYGDPRLGCSILRVSLERGLKIKHPIQDLKHSICHSSISTLFLIYFYHIASFTGNLPIPPLIPKPHS